ncbi:MAG: peptidylprolyl isomerase [Nitrospinaceae bacterium]
MIKKDSVVSLSYILKNENGEELDRSETADPLTYMHGHGQIVPGLENALEGLTVGEKKEVSVSPRDGYGEVIPQLKMKVNRDKFPADANIEPGMQFTAKTEDDKQIPFTVQAVEGDEVMLDGNHPLAGEKLHFSVEVIEVRHATAEELQHGHVHGPGGHHH